MSKENFAAFVERMRGQPLQPYQKRLLDHIQYCMEKGIAPQVDYFALHCYGKSELAYWQRKYLENL